MRTLLRIEQFLLTTWAVLALAMLVVALVQADPQPLPAVHVDQDHLSGLAEARAPMLPSPRRAGQGPPGGGGT